MIVTLALLGSILAVWLAIAFYCRFRRGMSLHQAILHAPLKLAFRIDDRAMRQARQAEPPVIYAVWHQSRLEPALMLALLPEDTLHILDENSARAWWLEPWRALARTVVFNAHHVFVNRRLVRRLKGRGRLAIYLPDNESPDPKAFRLFRAVARIAVSSGARFVPVHVQGSERSHFSYAGDGKRGLLPRLTIRTLQPLTVSEMMAVTDSERPMAANALFDRMIEVRRGRQSEPEPVQERRAA